MLHLLWWEVGVVWVIAVVVLVVARRWWRTASLVMFHPLWLVIVGAAQAYVAGSAVLFAGVPFAGADGLNMDRTLRVPSRSWSLPRGDEGLVLGTHNAVTRVLVACFGSPVETYRGAYPTLAEADAALRSRGEAVDLWRFADQGRVVTASVDVTLDTGLARSILREMDRYGHLAYWSEQRFRLRAHTLDWTIDAVLVEPGCLVVWVPAVLDDRGMRAGPEDRVLLVDVGRGQVFAAYGDWTLWRDHRVVWWGR